MGKTEYKSWMLELDKALDAFNLTLDTYLPLLDEGLDHNPDFPLDPELNTLFTEIDAKANALCTRLGC